jgi:arginase
MFPGRYHQTSIQTFNRICRSFCYSTMTKKPLQSITLISSPYHVGFRDRGVGAGPALIQSLGLLPLLKELSIPITEVEIEPVDDFEGEIGRSFEIIRRTSTLVSEAHNCNSFPIILSGNCSAAVGVAAGYTGSSKAAQEQEPLGCVWFDAHDDYNIPDTVMSGYFDSQPVAMLGGECWRGLLGTIPGHIPMDLKHKFVNVGMRDVNELERQRVLQAGFDVVWGDEQNKPDFGQLLHAVLEKKSKSATTASPTMVHFDVDSLDISLGKANQFAAPGGLLEADVHACFDAIVQNARPVSLTVASLDPAGEGADRIAAIAVRGVHHLLASLVSKGVFGK